MNNIRKEIIENCGITINEEEEKSLVIKRVLGNKKLLDQTSAELAEMMKEYKDVFEALAK